MFVCLQGSKVWVEGNSYGTRPKHRRTLTQQAGKKAARFHGPSLHPSAAHDALHLITAGNASPFQRKELLVILSFHREQVLLTDSAAFTLYARNRLKMFSCLDVFRATGVEKRLLWKRRLDVEQLLARGFEERFGQEEACRVLEIFRRMKKRLDTLIETGQSKAIERMDRSKNPVSKGSRSEDALPLMFSITK